MTDENLEGVYLYCLGRADRLRPEGIGVDGVHPLQQVVFEEIGAVISMVALADFCGPAAEAKLGDIAWVAPRACRHEEVVEKMMRQTPVFPVRFGTIFSSAQSLKQVLARNHDLIIRFLEAMQGKAEWAVKGFFDKAAARTSLFESALADHSASSVNLSAGMQYFHEKRISGQVEDWLKALIRELCARTGEDLGPLAVDVCERKTLAREVSGRALDMIFNRAYLIPAAAAEQFKTRLAAVEAACSQQGLVLELSGPWPPYSFCPTFE